MKKLILLLLVLSFYKSYSQETFPVNGVYDDRNKSYAFTHATIVVDATKQLTDATLVIKDGNIVDVNTTNTFPKDAVEINLKGKFIYPSFIDLYSDYGVAKITRTDRGSYEQMLSKKRGAYDWNQAIHPETNANEIFATDPSASKALRQAGFGTVLTHQQDGIVRGSGCVVTLSDEHESKVILKEKASANYSFSKGSSSQDYPSSLMGAIALLRQTYYDADWYKQMNGKTEVNISLATFNQLQNMPQIFQAEGYQNILRASQIAKEFHQQYILKTNGTEYQRLDDIKATGCTLIVPLVFPKAIDVSDPVDAANVSLSEMKQWELAPYNAGMLEAAKIPFAFTYSGSKSQDEFWKNIRKSIKCGLSETQALQALTTTPAQLIGIADKVGSIEKGKQANFLICSTSIFDDKNVLFQNWVQGTGYVLKDLGYKDFRGYYSLTAESFPTMQMQIIGSANTPEIKMLVLKDSTKLKVNYTIQQNIISFNFNYPKDTSKAQYRFSGLIDDTQWKGQFQNMNGDWLKWSAAFSKPFEEKKDTTKKKATPLSVPKIMYPFNGYGWQTKPSANSFLIKNTTVWTNEADGILTTTDVLVENGKIKAIGKNLTAADGVQVIDGTDKNLTPGIIDEHSHIAASGDANEGTQNVTSEVRIGDIINGEDINIYRQLSGGVTCSHILHGSANPIGGQTQLIKLRWGMTPEQMKFADAPGFIKFALGENVKQSNWGDFATTRFPQTRMGVEQVYVNAFTRAKNYEQAMKNKTAITKRDLELDALIEILNSKRFITCHSYEQSEINMLMHVADSFHFKINTFTHILEGYKVADKMKAHGVKGASTFADWWAYKFEVMEAIPQNAGLMTQVGLTVAVNSDDAEMGRRLNQEAAKSVKYTGMTEEEAFKMCSLNPAKMLRVDDKTGSVKVGKDADLVLWSANPLSIYAVVEKTFVDGVCYYDKKEDEQKREFIKQEKARLVAKMIQAKKDGEAAQPATKSPETTYYSCSGDEKK